jgi:hypothetical protein
MIKKSVWAGVAISSLLFLAPAITLAATSTFGSYTWNTLKIGAGGFLTGMDMAADGTQVIRADTFNGFVWTGSTWRPLLTTQTMPAADAQYGTGTGIYEIKIAPTNTNRFYMMYNGYVYRTDNKGLNWTKTNFPHATGADSNDNYRTRGGKMAVDPLNADTVITGAGGSGVWRTADGGTTWTQIVAIPATPADANGQYPGTTGIVFDPTGGSTGGRTNIVYAASAGNGVYRSTDNGVTWTKTVGGPTTVVHAQVAKDGILYVGSGDGAWRYASGTWTNLTNNPGGPTQGATNVLVDPFNPAHIVAMRDGGVFDQSLDRGTTWAGYLWGGNPPITSVATDIPWLAVEGSGYKADGDTFFDPNVQNKIWMSEGVGIWWVNLPPNNTWNAGFQWNSQSAGIEQLVADEIISPPGGKPLTAVWDRSVFYIDNPDTYRTKYGPIFENGIVAGWSVDYASSMPSYVAGIFNWWGKEESAYSTDGGQTWTQFATKPAQVIDPNLAKIGGSIAAASPTNLVWLPSNNGIGYYTKDGGATWLAANFPGAPTTGESGWSWAYYLKRQNVAADRVNIGTFYAYNYLKGLYRSTDGGTTWTLVKTGEISQFSGYNAKIRAVPGQAGNLFFTGGPQSTNGAPHPVNEPFMRSTDGGVTWTAVPNALEVIDFGFGAPKVAGAYPSIYIGGWVNGVGGIWRSDDNAATWTQLSDLFPLYSLDSIVNVYGDMNIYGRVYAGFAGSGYAYADTGSGTTNTVSANLSANPTSITSGQSSTLAWSSTNATSCTGTGFTASGTSGTVTVSPSVTTNYSVTCTGATGSASASATVTVGQVTQQPTASLSANPTSITSGQSSTLTWSSTNATSCTGSGFTASGTSGSVTVSPSVTTNYSVTCSGTGGSASGSATVTVGSTPPPPPPTFSVGARVKTTSNLNVRNKANTNAGKVQCVQPAGALGTITSGPSNGQGYTWWNVNFDASCDGYVVQTYLTTNLTSVTSSGGPFGASNLTQTLVLGSSGPEVTLLQQMLQKLDHFSSDVTGFFGPLTEQSVKEFQAANNIAAVGIVGPQTRALLNQMH